MDEPRSRPSPRAPSGQKRSRSRFLLWLALALSWVVLLPLLWSAVTTMPSPERLEQTRTVAIPTLRGLVGVVALSGVEVAFVLLLLWPGWRAAYSARVLFAGLGLAAWFVFSTPLSMSRLQWVHRRWLALLAFTLLLVALLRLARTVARRFSRAAPPGAAG